MVFSSIIFLFYFLPVFFILYYLSPHKLRNYVILLGSLVFYSWGGPAFVFVILCTTALDFIFVRQIERSHSTGRKKTFLCFSLVLNLGLLFGFKYLHFATTTIDHFLHWTGRAPIGMEKIALPIGISFFTFESLTYVIDVYRGNYKSLRNFADYLTYILMFPKLIAGPIVPYNKIASQIETERIIRPEARLAGLMRFIFGLSKKVLIANVIGGSVDALYHLQPGEIGTLTAWMMSIGYTMQLYFDFSGYCDMAIGLCSMMGFRIPENFNFPYISRSITEFWRRWHISLGNWMKNYLYIPLGGNKESERRTYLNLWLVFVISGLWHGAGWHFILWGVYHGFFLVIERLFLKKYLDNFLGLVYTFFVANLGWVLFRNDHISETLVVWKKMFVFTPSAPLHDTRFIFVLCAALLFSFSGLFKRFYSLVQNEENFFSGSSLRLGLLYTASLLLFVLSAAYLCGENFNPFIYFRF
ncbi:MAG: MBOAT family O-acyltransferase [Bacteroidia bacterium]